MNVRTLGILALALGIILLGIFRLVSLSVPELVVSLWMIATGFLLLAGYWGGRGA